MAFSASRALLKSRFISRARYVCPQCRHYAIQSPSELPAPPLLLKLRKDLKTAMREKDTNRLNVLRSIIADVTSSAKTNSPIKTDMQMLSLLRKRANAAKQATSEFKAAGRDDLVEKEQEQADVIEEYAGGVETMSEDDIREEVIKVLAEEKDQKPPGKVNMGDVLKKLLAPGGSLDGKPVERSEVARIVKSVLIVS